jgi:hypothetical protein
LQIQDARTPKPGLATVLTASSPPGLRLGTVGGMLLPFTASEYRTQAAILSSPGMGAKLFHGRMVFVFAAAMAVKKTDVSIYLMLNKIKNTFIH